jgi:uncharacterized protein (DUF58 family)
VARVNTSAGLPAAGQRRWARVLGRRYHFHSPGLAYAVTTMVLVLGAVNGQNNLLFWLFGLAVAGLLISGILSGGSLMRLDVEREIPSSAGVGDEVVTRYRIRNRSRVFPAFGLTVEELTSVRGGGTPTWAGRLSQPRAYALYVPAQGTVVVEARAGALGRGAAELGPIRIWTTFPFGLTKKSKAFRQDATVLIRPRPAPLRPGAINGLAGRGELGSILRRSRGGEEFYSLREYTHGDSVRAVAWRSTARLGHAVVREMAARPSRHVWIVLDFGGGDTPACERAISVAAALCAGAAEAGLEPGLGAPDGRLLEPARAGRRHVGYLMDALGRLDIPWLRDHGAELPHLHAGAYVQDAFVVVQAGPESSPPPTASTRVLRVDDASLFTSDWSPSIPPASVPARETALATLKRLAREFFSGGNRA